MASPVARETITLNAGELKHTIIKALLTSINHHYYLTALQTKFAIPMIRKHDEAELTIMYPCFLISLAAVGIWSVVFVPEEVFAAML